MGISSGKNVLSCDMTNNQQLYRDFMGKSEGISEGASEHLRGRLFGSFWNGGMCLGTCHPIYGSIEL